MNGAEGLPSVRLRRSSHPPHPYLLPSSPVHLPYTFSYTYSYSYSYAISARFPSGTPSTSTSRSTCTARNSRFTTVSSGRRDSATIRHRNCGGIYLARHLVRRNGAPRLGPGHAEAGSRPPPRGWGTRRRSCSRRPPPRRCSRRPRMVTALILVAARRRTPVGVRPPRPDR